MVRYLKTLSALAIVAGLTIGTGDALAEIQKVHFKVVGGWANVSAHEVFEKPFWQETLPKASGGKITGSINPITELGLKGFEVLRLLKLGVFDAAYGVLGYVTAEDPAIEGIDLSSIATTFEEARKIADASGPILTERFDKSFNAKFLTTYAYPSQVLWCNKPVMKLSDLKGKKVRVYSTTLGDFVEGGGPRRHHRHALLRRGPAGDAARCRRLRRHRLHAGLPGEMA